jgi:hypothetical protein
MKLAQSGSRGVFWRANPRGTHRRTLAPKQWEQGDWWIRWACPHGHLHRKLIGAKSVANDEAGRQRLEGMCPTRTSKPESCLLSEVIDAHLTAAKAHKRTWREDQRYGKTWKARFAGRTLDDITAGEVEKFRTERLPGQERCAARHSKP